MSKVTISEAAYTKKVTQHLKSLPKCWFFKVWGGGYQRAGIPDIIGVLNGRLIGIELKSSVGKPSALQLRNVKLINDAGGYAVVSKPQDFDDLVKDLEAILNERRK